GRKQMGAPLHCQGEKWRWVIAGVIEALLAFAGFLRLEQPQRAGIPWMSDKRNSVSRFGRFLAATVRARPNEKIGDVVEASLRFGSVEKRLDSPVQQPPGAAMATQMTADEGQREVVH